MSKTAKARKRAVDRLARGPAGPWVRVDGAVEGAPAGATVVRNNHVVAVCTREESGWGPIIHIAVRRLDAQPIRSWAALQRMKNELVGEDRVAVEVFPRASESVDDGMLHLWVFGPGVGVPFGLHKPTGRFVEEPPQPAPEPA